MRRLTHQEVLRSPDQLLCFVLFYLEGVHGDAEAVLHVSRLSFGVLRRLFSSIELIQQGFIIRRSSFNLL